MAMQMLTAYWRLFRPAQWLKNVIVFAPLFFGHHFADVPRLIATTVAFIAFCLCASAVYCINDALDAPRDALHPVKRHRPVAAGVITPRQSVAAGVVTCVIALVCAFLVSRTLAGVLALYIALNLFYSVKAKHMAMIDILILAVFYILRLFAGEVASGIELSHWIIIVTFTGSIMLACGKRREELIANAGKETRKSLDGYNVAFLNAAMTVAASATFICYVMYSIDEHVVAVVGRLCYLTSFFVLGGILQYVRLVLVFGYGDNPVKMIISDRVIIGCVVCWIGVLAFLIYG